MPIRARSRSWSSAPASTPESNNVLDKKGTVLEQESLPFLGVLLSHQRRLEQRADAIRPRRRPCRCRHCRHAKGAGTATCKGGNTATCGGGREGRAPMCMHIAVPTWSAVSKSPAVSAITATLYRQSSASNPGTACQLDTGEDRRRCELLIN